MIILNLNMTIRRYILYKLYQSPDSNYIYLIIYNLIYIHIDLQIIVS